jgi:formate-dependent nitrite reductase membrane component NrfD
MGNDNQIVGDTFKVGYRFQRYWDTSMAAAFFCCELGAGLFMLAQYYGSDLGMLVGLLFAGVGKPYFHLAHMGVPSKSWRAMMRPDRSWISRGLIAIMFFVSAGVVYLLQHKFGLLTAIFGESLGGALTSLAHVVGFVAGVVVMSYQGFAMAHSSSFALWNTGLMPISSIAYAITSGLAALLVLGWNGWLAARPETRELLVNFALVMLLVDLAIIMSLLHGAYHGTSGGRQSVGLLLKGVYAKPFIGGVIGIGILLPALLFWIGGYFMVLLATAAILVGFFAYRVLIFKAALYEPILSFKPRTARL